MAARHASLILMRGWLDALIGSAGEAKPVCNFAESDPRRKRVACDCVRNYPCVPLRADGPVAEGNSVARVKHSLRDVQKPGETDSALAPATAL
jgi:hypothetical protein